MNIAYIGAKTFPARAGADHAVEAIVRRLAGRHNLTVYCSARETASEVDNPGVNIIRVPALAGKHAYAASLFGLAAVQTCLRGDFDLVHVHNVEACFVLPLLKARYKVIATSQGRAYLVDKWGPVARVFFRATERAYIRLADTATAVSDVLARYYTQRYGREVNFIPNGVDRHTAIDLAPAQSLLRAAALPEGNYLLFAAGRILPSKGLETLLAAYCALDTELRLLVVGDASHISGYADKLRQLADARVVFLPIVDQKTLLGLVQLARLFIFPSTIEAMSMMLLEAAATGTPIISSDIPENSTVLPQRALFFRRDDPQDLHEKLRWALVHPTEMQALGRQAQTWVHNHYAWDNIVLQYERLYQALA